MELNAFGKELEIKEVIMKARRMKSSKYKQKTRRDSSRGIHPSLLVSAAACLLFRRSRNRDSEVTRVFFLSLLSTVRTNFQGGILLYNLVLFIQ